MTVKRLQELLESSQFTVSRFKKQVDAFKTANPRSKKHEEASEALGSAEIAKHKRFISAEWEKTRSGLAPKKWKKVLELLSDSDIRSALSNAAGLSLWRAHFCIYLDLEPSPIHGKGRRGTTGMRTISSTMGSSGEILKYRRTNGTVDGYLGIKSVNALHTIARLKARGMTVQRSFTAEVTHVILVEGEKACSDHLLAELKKARKNVHYASYLQCSSLVDSETDQNPTVQTKCQLTEEVTNVSENSVFVLPISWAEKCLEKDTIVPICEHNN